MPFLGSKYAKIAFTAGAPPRPGSLPVRRQTPELDLRGREGRNGRGRKRGGEDGCRGRDGKLHSFFLRFLDPPMGVALKI